MNFISFYTDLGGGKEIGAWCFLVLLFCKRERFFYALFVNFSVAGIIGYLKMAYAEPRPFWMTPEIKAYGCNNEFGNPSGHSCSAATFSIAVFLDYFHGTCYDERVNLKPVKHHWFTWAASLTFALLWIVAIPFSRFALGMHSLDQLLYGGSLGIWLSFTAHFLFRDHILDHVTTIKAWHRREEDGDRRQPEEGNNNEGEAEDFQPNKPIISMLAAYSLFLALTLITWAIINSKFPDDSAESLFWDM